METVSAAIMRFFATDRRSVKFSAEVCLGRFSENYQLCSMVDTGNLRGGKKQRAKSIPGAIQTRPCALFNSATYEFTLSSLWVLDFLEHVQRLPVPGRVLCPFSSVCPVAARWNSRLQRDTYNSERRTGFLSRNRVIRISSTDSVIAATNGDRE